MSVPGETPIRIPGAGQSSFRDPPMQLSYLGAREVVAAHQASVTLSGSAPFKRSSAISIYALLLSTASSAAATETSWPDLATT
jgi:hypothetical protein